MGTHLSTEREAHALSLLARNHGLRILVRALLFAGVVGAAWFIGSSSADARPIADAQVMTHRGIESSVDMVENNTERIDARETRQRESESSCVADAALVPEDTADAKTARHSNSSKTSKTSKSWCLSTSAQETTSNTQDLSQLLRHLYENPEGSASTDVDPDRSPVSGAAAGTGATTSPFAPTNASRSLSGDRKAPHEDVAPRHQKVSAGGGDVAVRGGVLVAWAPVNPTVANAVASSEVFGDHIANTVWSGVRVVAPLSVPAPLTGVTSGGADSITTALMGLTWSAPDVLVGDLLSRWGSEIKLVEPLVGTPRPEGPAIHKEQPVAPGIASSGGTPPNEADGAAMPSTPHRSTGMKDAVPASKLPAPSPLPTAPGAGVHTGGATGSHLPTSEGGATATVPALSFHGAYEFDALFTTAHHSSPRDLAGEPAVSPD